MTWLTPLHTGLEMGLVMSFSVLGLATAYRLLNVPDLTVEGSFLLGAVGFALATREGLGIVPGLLVAAAFGGTAGMLTGLLHSRFNINKFLAGIIVASICYTLALRLMGTSNLGLLSVANQFDHFADKISVSDWQTGKISLLLAATALVGALIVITMSSRTGLRWRVATCNPHYARTLGIGIIASFMLGLAVTNALAALSGAFLSVHQGFADVGLGQGVLILTLASMAVGDRILSERRITPPTFIVISSILGSIIYQCLVALAIRAGLNPIDLKLITAALILVLVIARSKTRDDPFASA